MFVRTDIPLADSCVTGFHQDHVCFRATSSICGCKQLNMLTGLRTQSRMLVSAAPTLYQVELSIYSLISLESLIYRNDCLYDQNNLIQLKFDNQHWA